MDIQSIITYIIVGAAVVAAIYKVARGRNTKCSGCAGAATGNCPKSCNYSGTVEKKEE